MLALSDAARAAFAGAYAGRSVLVTGHTGFKGSWLALWLGALGARVVGLSSDRPIAPRHAGLCRLKQRIARHVAADVRDFPAVLACVAESRPSVIFHLAAQPIVIDSYQSTRETMETNALGTVNVLEAARRSRSVAAVVAVTTDKVYDEERVKGPFDEQAPLAGHDPYSASKAMAELAVRSFRLSWQEPGFAAHPCRLATARAGNAIGGGDFAPRRLLPDIFRSLAAHQPFVIKTPRSVRPWQSVLDALSGYLQLGARLLSGSSEEFAGAWNFGPAPGDTVTCENLARRTFELWGAPYDPIVAPEPRRQAARLVIDSRQAVLRLGWQPLWTWQEALERTVAWFKEYERRCRAAGGAPEAPDMLDLCLAQIEDYTARGREAGAAWARGADPVSP